MSGLSAVHDRTRGVGSRGVQNVTGRVGSDQEAFKISRVGSGQVGSGRVKSFPNLTVRVGSGRVKNFSSFTGRVGSGHFFFQIKRVGSGHGSGRVGSRIFQISRVALDRVKRG